MLEKFRNFLDRHRTKSCENCEHWARIFETENFNKMDGLCCVNVKRTVTEKTHVCRKWKKLTGFRIAVINEDKNYE